MALPLLPQNKILSIINVIEEKRFDISPSYEIHLGNLKKYVKKQWILKENYLYYESLKSKIKIHRPNIWSFLDCLEEILYDFDLEYARLEQGLEICCPGNKKHKENASKRNKCKEKLRTGIYGPLEYLVEVSSTIGKQ